jgi:hydroxymethylbilane synthase
MTKLVLATRKSPLALAQTEMVAAHLRAHLGVETELLKIVTTGDRRPSGRSKKGAARGSSPANSRPLLRGEADVAVHSTKDLPGDMPPGLAIGGYMPRADTRDVLVLRAAGVARRSLGTGSPRRRLQIAKLFPEVDVHRDSRQRGYAPAQDRRTSRGRRHGARRRRAEAPRHRVGRASSLCRWSSTRWCPRSGRARLRCSAARPTPRNLPRCSMRPRRAVSRSSARFKTALGGGCHTAFAAHVTRAMAVPVSRKRSDSARVSLTAGRLSAPADTAAHVLREFGLLP